MASYGGGHVNLMMPVYERLAPGNDVVFLGLSIAGIRLRERGIPFKNYSSYVGSILDDDARRFGKELAELWHVDGKVDRKESEAYLGACMRDLVLDHGEIRAREFLARLGRKAFVPKHTARRIIEVEQPDVIVTTNSPRTERALTLAGNAMGIPTVNIHDHLGFEERHMLEADRVAVMCSITRDNLVRTGHEPRRVVITGQPAFDAILHELASFDRATLCRRHGLDPAAKYVLFGSQKQFTEAMLADLFDQIGSLDGYTLLVKPHPGEDYAMYERLMPRYPHVRLITDVNIREIIFISEAMIAMWSTVALEAVLMQKPLVQLDYPELPNIVPLFQYGVALRAENAEAVGYLVRQALADVSLSAELMGRRDAIFADLLTGRSTEAFVNLIVDVARAGKENLL